MIKADLLIDKLTRANERLKMIEEVENEAGKLEKCKAKWKKLTGEEKI